MAVKFGQTLILVGFLLTSLMSQATFAQEAESPVFQLLILPSDWLSSGLGYDAEEAFPKLEAGDYSSAVFTLTLEDLASYHWDWQTLTLTTEATERLIKALPDLAERQADVQSLIDLKASLGFGNPLENALYAQPFVVLVEGKFLYGGIFLDAMSQMAINYPVIRVELVGGQAVFNLLPTHIPFVNYDPAPREETALDEAFTPILDADRADAPDFFANAVEGWSTAETAVYFRTVIRAEPLYESVLASGKLIPPPE